MVSFGEVTARNRSMSSRSSAFTAYRSARAVTPIRRRSRFATPRLKWKLIKMAIFIFGMGWILSAFYVMGPNDPNKMPFDGASLNTGIQSSDSAGDVKVSRYLARGIAGLPMSQTPALLGASRGHIECDVNVDELVYWNAPQGTRDLNFVSPFIGKQQNEKTKYLTFEPDRGGWNNIRMNLENIFIMAAATNRTLVLPPASPLYLLSKDKKEKHKNFGDFFNLQDEMFQKRIKIITMEEFLEREGGSNGQYPIPEKDKEDVLKSSAECDQRAKSDIACDHIFEYLRSIAYTPQYNGTTCLVWDQDKFNHGSISHDAEKRVKEFCFPRKNIHYIDQSWQDEPIIHIISYKNEYRIMQHYYGYMYFTDPSIFNHYKRFVRDYMHYHDEIYCAAGKIVLALQEEGQKLGFKLDEENGGGFSSMHVRRGDLQYKKVKISAEEWYNNLKDTWANGEIIYIATDERNKTFFDPIKDHHPIRFLDDYWEMAGLGNLDPNYMGMIDTIVASRGRVFAGTFFSTFSGYINRMRGYHGMSMKNSYYGYLPKKTVLHEWHDHYDGNAFSYEWPNGWIGIDGDTEPSRDKF